MMGEKFLKSALDASMAPDTALALPSGSSSAFTPDQTLDLTSGLTPDLTSDLTPGLTPGPQLSVDSHRSLRVRQQVQLTLARRNRRTLSHGSVSLLKSSGRSLDHSDGQMRFTKTNCLGFSNHSPSTKPSRRVEVTPPPSPEVPFGTPRLGLYPALGPAHTGLYTVPGYGRLRSRLDRSVSQDSHLRYAFSDGSHRARPPRSATHRRRSFRHVALPQPLFEDEVFLPNAEKVRSSRQSQVKNSPQVLRRINSYPPSASSFDQDLGGPDRPEVDQTTTAHQTVTLGVSQSRGAESQSRGAEMTLERAVNLLSQDDEETVVSAASFIQNQCFKSADAKKMVYFLHGIEKLLRLLAPDGEEEVQRAAAGALRNIVFQSDENKLEVKDKNGLSTILKVLKSSRDVETRRQLTGLLWNLSSHELLKEQLSVDSLPILSRAVLVPCSGLSEGENPKDELLADNEVFHNATGCLRNLSSAGPIGRTAMRECENLIDSLVYYVRGSIADYKTDDKTTENCVCVLHNLSYQLEEELPRRLLEELHQSQLSVAPEPKPVTCFSLRTPRIQQERHCPLLEEKSNPCGVEWLWNSITVRMYLSLIARSERCRTQEGALGALQNITAGHGPVTEALCVTIAQKENGLLHVRRTLKDGDGEVRRTAVSLVRNLSRMKELHRDIVAHVLAELVSMLPSKDSDPGPTPEPTPEPTPCLSSCLCQVLLHLSQNQSESVRAIVNHGALPQVISLSRSGGSRSAQAACAVLRAMWKHTELHGLYKKCGFRKTDFINSRTTKAIHVFRD